MSRLTALQHEQLLKAINPNRVGKDRNNRAHVEAYEIRAHLIRIFGPAGWSQRVTDMQLIFEDVGEKDGKPVVSVAYRAQVQLTVFSTDGDTLATYSEWATGDAANFPIKSRGDAHDFAIKTAESQGLKRCAMNLGDQFGLSLYRQGSVQALVGRSLVTPTGQPAPPAPAPVDEHIDQPLPAESEEAEDKRESNAKQAPPQTAVTAQRAEQEAFVLKFREELLNPPANAKAPWYARKQLDATKAGVMRLLVEDRDSNMVTVAAFIQQEQTRARQRAA